MTPPYDPLTDPEALDIHEAVWLSFLIFRDLPYRLSASVTKYKCGVEFYNAEQFAHQFGMVQFIPNLPYQSKNDNFIERPILTKEELKRVVDFNKTKASSFELLKFNEVIGASKTFTTWLQKYISQAFLANLEKTLANISSLEFEKSKEQAPKTKASEKGQEAKPLSKSKT